MPRYQSRSRARRAIAARTAGVTAAAALLIGTAQIGTVLATGDSTPPSSSAAAEPALEAPFRTIITTDADAFPKDDAVSFYRMLMYGNEFADSLEAIIYSSFFVPVAEGEWDTYMFQRIIRDEYSQVYENLLLHDPTFPAPQDLLSRILVGNIGGVSNYSYDSEGSVFIRDALLEEDPRPIFLQAWGGTSTIGAALRSIEDEFSSSADWEQIQADVSAKATIYSILDQDAVFKEYIDASWPELNVIVNRDQFWAVAYPGQRAERVPPELNDYLGPEFMATITQGPMLSNVPVAVAGGDGPFGVTEELAGSCFCEGDSPAFFYLIANGLRSHEDPAYGGWGGRFAQTGDHRWSDSLDYMELDHWPNFMEGEEFTETRQIGDASPFGPEFDAWYPQSRWIPALQNDYLARVAWQTATFEEANHPPVVTATGELDVTASAGDAVQLAATATDPDGDALTATWWQYAEAGTYAGAVEIEEANSIDGASAVIPADAVSGDTIHFIVEVVDDGVIPLTRYQRIIVTVG